MTRLVAIAPLLVLLACSSVQAPTLPPGDVVAVIHSSGGPGPTMAWLGVYPNREAVFRSPDWKLSRAKIDELRFQRIMMLLARPELRTELESLTSRSEPYSDFEEVFFLFGEKEYRFVCREVKPEGTVLELLREVRGIAAFRVGGRAFAGPACTSEPPN